jgi:hypothetical protein
MNRIALKKETVMNPNKRLWLLPLPVGIVLLVLGRIKTPMGQIENWQGGAATSLGIAGISTSLVELSRSEWKRKKSKQFEKFFGVHTGGGRGHIVLKDDRVDTVLRGSGATQPLMTRLMTTRFRKARRWINAHDVDGARAVRDAFREMNFTPPELTMGGFDGGYDHSQAPLVICMGLGFTDESINIIGHCKGWMIADPETKNGDAIGLDRRLCGDPEDFERTEIGKDGYKRLFPLGWNLDTYLKVPDRLPEESGTTAIEPTSKDYAIILRHTEEPSADGSQRIWFVVAGFTAHGTSAAGRYLARNWRKLATRHIKENGRDGDGDFLEVIVGNSGASNWEVARNIPCVTPEYLASDKIDIDCEWSRRYKRHQRPPSA